MTDLVDVVNLGLQYMGSRTTVTQAELDNETSNEAIQANLILERLRDETLRKAPWNCALTYNNLVYITSAPGTPENTSSGTEFWERGQPYPPWAYEYQYPVDCLRPVLVVPQYLTGFAGGVPITTAVTGGQASFWQGPPVVYKVATDDFFPVTAAAVVAGGTGYAVGDRITLPIGPTTATPIGAPVVLQVATLAGSAVATVTVVNQIAGSATPQGGSYFARQTGTIAQSTTTGLGTGATFTLTFGSKGTQRVILTNQEYAILAYIKQVTDPNVMDPLFLDAWAAILGARLSIPLSGDKSLAKLAIEVANDRIIEARKADGNEGLTVNDVTPDWVRTRGVLFSNWTGSAGLNVDWGSLWSGV